jgi:hypothetical protein
VKPRELAPARPLPHDRCVPRLPPKGGRWPGPCGKLRSAERILRGPYDIPVQMPMKMESQPRYRFISSLACAMGILAAGCSGGSGRDDAGGATGIDGGVLGGQDAVSVDAMTGGGSDARTNSCPGPIQASWSVDGVPYLSSTVLLASLGTVWNLTMVECMNDGVDSTVQIGGVPGPVAVGSYPISFTILHGQASPDAAGATWSVTSGGAISDPTNYYTDPSHTGVVTVTSIDSAASTFSGTFSFSAINDAGTHVVQVSDGVLTNIKFAL